MGTALQQGEMELGKLLAGMRPSLGSDRYVFCVVDPQDPGTQALRQAALATILEEEGLTLVVPVDSEGELPTSGVYRVLTLHVHSALEAVGFLAAIATELARHAISANTLSAYYHDHLLIPEERAQEALDALTKLSARYREA